LLPIWKASFRPGCSDEIRISQRLSDEGILAGYVVAEISPYITLGQL